MSVRRFFLFIWQAHQRLPYFILFFPLFLLLYLFEALYRLGFWCVRQYHKIFVTPVRFDARVISVGNVTVGGTGKSVVVHYLLDRFGHQKCGVIMRGYGGANEKKNEPLLVGGWGKIFSTPHEAGDEAFALARATDVPVVVCASKKKAGRLLLDVAHKKKKKIEYIVLDDGYQSVGIARDIDIVLLDARAPFGNEHCLPAGPLREKSLQRATHIFVTHADQVSEKKYEEVRALIAQQKGDPFLQSNVLFGSHQFAGIWQAGQKKVSPDVLRTQRFYALAGIGAPKGFFSMLQKNGIKTFKNKVFDDHYAYTHADITALQLLGGPFVTTQKDWVKIETLLEEGQKGEWYICRVVFSSQSPQRDLAAL